MEQTDVQLLIYFFSGIFLVICIFPILLIFYIQRKKLEYILEKERSTAKFEELLADTKEEITKQNLQYVSWELHDNIGQLLSAASIQMQMLAENIDIKPEELNESITLLSDAITEIRSLSKSLNHDQLAHNGLIYMISNELERISRMKLIKINAIIPEQIVLSKNKELILFRVIQEFITNSIKHAHAKHVFLSIKVESNNVIINLRDDGQGFELNKVKHGNGILNIESRIKSINSTGMLNSVLGKGTILNIEIPIDEEV